MTRKLTKIPKIGFLFFIIVLSLAGLSISYAGWTDTINIDGTITTADDFTHLSGNPETAWARMYDDSYDYTYEFPGNNWATYIIHQPTTQTAFYLYAGQHYKVGVLNISKDDTNLIIEYDLDDGFDMEETQLHIATTLDSIPQNNGNPTPGQFQYKQTHDPSVTEYTYTIPWDSSWDDIDLYIAAHAVVWGIY